AVGRSRWARRPRPVEDVAGLGERAGQKGDEKTGPSPV
ncbi:MAG: hypothetical protein AVDCRST_MAG03-2828, partial [uncultured Rubrobacteraceae bacterium]